MANRCSRRQFLATTASGMLASCVKARVARWIDAERVPIWQERGEAGAAATDRGVRWIVDDTSAQPGARGVVSAYATATTARRLAQLGEPERIQETSADVGSVHIGLEDYLERTASYCWDSDPFAQGAHSAPAPGQLPLVGRLARPEGRIYFAGEHLSEAPGWMEGAMAMASGRRAARDLL